MRYLGCGLLTIAVLSGCASGNHKTAYRIKQVKEADTVAVVTTDALQRSVVIRKAGGTVQFCAEKFPDAFSVLAASQSLNLGADVKSQSGNLGLSQSFNETGTAIQRTQAANLLAESLYRTCERFMNGQIDQSAAAEQATRDANNIVAVLAVEQLTSMGRVEPRIVISGGGASIGGGAIEVLAAQQGKLNVAIEARKAADADATAILAGFASCDAIGDADKKAACTKDKPELDRKLANADKAAKDQQALYDAMLKSANSGTPMQAGAQAAVTSFMGSHTVSDAAVKDIANAVVEIVKANFAANSTCERAREALANGRMSPQAFSTACAGAFAKPQALTEASKIQGGKIWKSNEPKDLALTANVYVQYANSNQRAQVLALLKSLNANKSGVGNVLGPELLDNVPDVSELRCYDEVGCKTAANLAQLLKNYLPKLDATPKNFGAAFLAKPTIGTVELWISRDESITLPN